MTAHHSPEAPLTTIPTLDAMRAFCANSRNGAQAFGALLRQFPLNHGRVDHGATIKLFVSMLNTLMTEWPTKVVELHMTGLKGAGFTFSEGRSDNDRALAACFRLVGMTRAKDNHIGLSLGLRQVVHTTAADSDTTILQVIITVDSLIVGGRMIWERD